MHEAIVAILVEGVPAPPAVHEDTVLVLDSVPGSPAQAIVLDEGASPAVRAGSALAEAPAGPGKRKRDTKPVKRMLSMTTVYGDEAFADPPSLLLSPRAAGEDQGAAKTEAQVHQLVRTFSMYEPPALVHDAVDPALLFARSPKRSRHDCDIKALSPLKKVSLTFEDLRMFDKDPV